MYNLSGICTCHLLLASQRLYQLSSLCSWYRASYTGPEMRELLVIWYCVKVLLFYLLLENHCSLHSCVEVLPVQILLNSSLFLKVLAWIPVLWYTELGCQIPQNRNTGNSRLYSINHLFVDVHIGWRFYFHKLIIPKLRWIVKSDKFVNRSTVSWKTNCYSFLTRTIKKSRPL